MQYECTSTRIPLYGNIQNTYNDLNPSFMKEMLKKGKLVALVPTAKSWIWIFNQVKTNLILVLKALKFDSHILKDFLVKMMKNTFCFILIFVWTFW